MCVVTFKDFLVNYLLLCSKQEKTIRSDPGIPARVKVTC